MSSLYLHIPFCSRKCRYCSFASVAGHPHLHERYCRALIREIETTPLDDRRLLNTLFIGGGTPSVLADSQLKLLLSTCAGVFGLTDDAEVTLETNPESLVCRDLDGLRRYGVNRVSIGIQSFNDDELAFLGRVHTAQQATQAFLTARRAGFDTISLDLMYGLPEQTPATWQTTLRQAIDLGPQHLSIYQLSIDDGTHFAQLDGQGNLSLPAEEQVAAMDDITARLCARAGFEQYELSNYRQPGYACRHNLVYWRNEDYFGCGAAAVSYRRRIRSSRTRDPQHYCALIESGASAVTEQEQLDAAAAFRETVVMGLRLNEGVSERRLYGRFGYLFSDIYADLFTKLVEDELLVWDGSRLTLSERGRQLANLVMRELV
ncbi:MAG: radical SAM family heme chaperone HemW [Desulfofustis sp.]|nr:radical SAM family heme chaperone HemW [Desulfofustis sp.]